MPEVKDEPLRLLLSRGEGVYIDQCLRAARFRVFAWLVVLALSVGAILGGAVGYGEVPYEIRVDKALAAGGEAIPDGKAAAACPGTYHLYSGNRQTVGFCGDDPGHAAFRERLAAADAVPALWPLANMLLIVLGVAGLMRAFIGVLETGIAIRRYQGYRDDLELLLRRYNRTA